MVMPRAFSSGAVVDLVVGLGFAAELLGQHGGDGRRQGGLAMVHVTDGAHVHVGFDRSNFSFAIFSTPKNYYPNQQKNGRTQHGMRPKLVPWRGIGPATSPLPRECSTTEPQGQMIYQSKSFNQPPQTHMERETGIEPASSAWKAGVLPLNYSRTNATEFMLLTILVEGLDSNQRRRKPTDLQSAPLATRAPSPGKRYSSRLLPKTKRYVAGAAGGDRTHDPWLRRPILHPLSYSRKPLPKW